VLVYPLSQMQSALNMHDMHIICALIVFSVATSPNFAAAVLYTTATAELLVYMRFDAEHSSRKL
jgi:hypothetical protein